MGFTFVDPDSVEWRVPPVNPKAASALDGNVQEKLLSPGIGGLLHARIIKFGPNVVMPRHSHSEAEFVYFLQGTGSWDGNPIEPGKCGYVGKDEVYGPEITGSDGLQMLLIRRAPAVSEGWA